MNPEHSTFEGVGYEADGSALPGTLSFIKETLRFEFEGGLWEIPLADLTVELQGTKTVCFASPALSGSSVQCCDLSILEHPVFERKNHLRAQAREIQERVDGVRRLKITVIAAAVFCVAALIATQLGGLLMDYLVLKVPTQWEVAEGDRVFDEVQEMGIVVTNQTLQAQIDFLGSELANKIPDKRLAFKFHLVNMVEPNAFAAPGGQVFITTGLMSIVETPEELAAVMAHEMAHVTQRHHLRRTVTTTGPYRLLRLLMSNRDGFFSSFSSGYQFLMSQSFSRDYEETADRVGWDYLIAANIAPSGMGRFLKRIMELEHQFGAFNMEAFSDHPLTAKRVAACEEKWSKLEKAHATQTFRDLVKEMPSPFPSKELKGLAPQIPLKLKKLKNK